MRIRSTWARWMAVRMRKRGRLDRAFDWYRRLGEARMYPQERVAYAELLHDLGFTDRALLSLSGVLAAYRLPEAYARRAFIYNDIGKVREAIADLNEAVRLDPAPAIYWYTRAICYSSLGEFGQAVRQMREAIARSDVDSRSSSYYELGCIYLRMERCEEAAEAFRQAIAASGHDVPLHRFRLAEALEGAGREVEALEEVQRAAASQSLLKRQSDQGERRLRSCIPYSETAIRTLMGIIDAEYGFRMKEAQLLERAGRREEALEAIDKGLADYPEADDLLLRRGALLRELGRMDESAAVLEPLHRRTPERLAVSMELCATLRKQARWPEAIATLKAALSLYPEHTVVRYWLVDVFREAKMADEAWAASVELTEMEPEDPLNWKQKAEVAIDRGRFGEADEAYTRVLALDDSADGYMRRSYARFAAERYEDAMLDLQSAMQRDESLREESKTAYAMAELYWGMGNRELADEEYGRAIRLEPDNPHLFERRAHCRIALQRPEDALRDCRSGLAIDPGNVRLLWLQCFIHRRLDDPESALAATLDYVRKVPDDHQGHHLLATIYSELGLYDDAIRSINRALELSPFEAQLYLERATLFYHQLFDRNRAAEDLAQWLLYAAAERPEDDRFAQLGELEGFDDEMREKAMEKFLNGYGASRYLS